MGSPTLDTLNAEQHAAAVHGDGAALVVAGPGTGKTTTLLGRYEYLVNHCGVAPERIFTATFTRRAAAQLQSRIAERWQCDARNLPIGTFHSLCARMLSQAGHTVHFMSSTQRAALLEEANAENSPVLLGDEDVRYFKNHLWTPSDVIRKAKHLSRRERQQKARFFERYETLRMQQNLADYEDLLGIVVDLLQPGAGGKSLPCYDYFMVDEYQDLNAAQDTLLKHLVGQKRNLWAVGDDDQAIYGFRGSNVEFIRGFHREYPGARRIKLREHYRSPSPVLAGATQIIEQNRRRHKKHLTSLVDAAPGLALIQAPSDTEEARAIAGMLERFRRSGRAYKDMAVLSRVNHVLRPLRSLLRKRGIPFFAPDDSTRDSYGDAVFISTVHQAKGLEWDVVFICGFEDDVFPHVLGRDQNLEEERRIAYVALTRAKRKVALSHCSVRGRRARAPSPFLDLWLRAIPKAQLQRYSDFSAA